MSQSAPKVAKNTRQTQDGYVTIVKIDTLPWSTCLLTCNSHNQSPSSPQGVTNTSNQTPTLPSILSSFQAKPKPSGQAHDKASVFKKAHTCTQCFMHVPRLSTSLPVHSLSFSNVQNSQSTDNISKQPVTREMSALAPMKTIVHGQRFARYLAKGSQQMFDCDCVFIHFTFELCVEYQLRA